MVSCLMEKKKDMSIIAKKLYSFTQCYSGGCLDYSESLIDSTEPAERRVSTGRVGTQSPQINWNPVHKIIECRTLVLLL